MGFAFQVLVKAVAMFGALRKQVVMCIYQYGFLGKLQVSLRLNRYAAQKQQKQSCTKNKGSLK